MSFTSPTANGSTPHVQILGSQGGTQFGSPAVVGSSYNSPAPPPTHHLAVDSIIQYYLVEGERVVHSGYVRKKKLLGSGVRLLVLTDFPRLFSIDHSKPPHPKNMKNIPFTTNLLFEQGSEFRFSVRSGDKVTTFDVDPQHLEPWHTAISHWQIQLKSLMSQVKTQFPEKGRLPVCTYVGM
eukprot:GFYU01029680.1.p1 GENE.GFYU01029680.1~~GFYU01029680.1.p1  ORF type:complete len:181 (+),score=20.66 GFYU01029680.1:314-856(+)